MTNPRVEINAESAALLALVEAQHLPRNDHGRNLLLKNFYRVRLERTDQRWLITRLRIENIWFRGDPTVLFPPHQP